MMALTPEFRYTINICPRPIGSGDKHAALGEAAFTLTIWLCLPVSIGALLNPIAIHVDFVLVTRS